MNSGLVKGHEYLKKLMRYEVSDLERKHQIIKDWNHSFKEKGMDSWTEQSTKNGFLNEFFKSILGYQEVFNANPWTMIVEARTQMDATTPDAVLGYFAESVHQVIAVIEVKAPSVSLDAKQKRKDSQSPVNQAFSYQHKFSYCEWVIVTNLKEVRLYSKDSSTRYESFWIEQMAGDILLFEKFCFFLSEENLIKPQESREESIVSELYKSSNINRKLIADRAVKSIESYSPMSDSEENKKKADDYLRRLKKTEFMLGDFVKIGHGINIPKKKRSDSLNSFNFSRYFTGEIEIFEPFNNFHYFDRKDLGDQESDESFFHGNRVLVRRGETERKSLRLSNVKASLAAESFFNGKEILNLLITDDRLTPEYVVALLNSRIVRKWHREHQKNGTLADSCQIVPTDLRRIPIVLPNERELELITSLVKQRMKVEKEFYEEKEIFFERLPDEYIYLEDELRNKRKPSRIVFNELCTRSSYREREDLKRIEQEWDELISRYYLGSSLKKFNFDYWFAKIYKLDNKQINFLFDVNTITE